MSDLEERVNANQRLVWRGRHLSTTFMVQVGEDSYLVKIQEGRMVSIRLGPFVQPNWSFVMRAPRSSWEKFWSPVPPPGFNDLIAMVNLGGLEIEGDMHVFMANLLYFKEVMAALRLQEVQS